MDAKTFCIVVGEKNIALIFFISFFIIRIPLSVILSFLSLSAKADNPRFPSFCESMVPPAKPEDDNVERKKEKTKERTMTIQKTKREKCEDQKVIDEDEYKEVFFLLSSR